MCTGLPATQYKQLSMCQECFFAYTKYHQTEYVPVPTTAFQYMLVLTTAFQYMLVLTTAFQNTTVVCWCESITVFKLFHFMLGGFVFRLLRNLCIMGSLILRGRFLLGGLGEGEGGV